MGHKYPVIFFDALRVKMRDDGLVRNKAVYLALGILPDGLRGIPESLAAAYPQAVLQTCIVHLRCGNLALCVRNSLDYASWKDRKAVAAALRPIYTASNDVAAEDALTAFEQSEWGAQLPHVAASWRRAWDYVTPFFAFPPEIRRVIYTTNAIEDVATSRYVPVNARIRKVIKTRGHFPNDEAATKLIWLALRNITKEWGGCPEFCVNGFRLMLRHSVLELDSKPV